MSDIITTTFHIEKERYQRFKRVVLESGMTVKATAQQMIDQWVEDHKDRTDLFLIEFWDRQSTLKGLESWSSFKRRKGLDGAQDYGQRDSSKRCRETASK